MTSTPAGRPRPHRRWVATAPGGLEVFTLETSEAPVAPGPGEVLIQVRAAGMNPADLKHVAHGAPETFPRGVGYEIAGVVVELGPGCDDSAPAVGAEVVAFRVRGGWADIVVAPQVDVLPKPASLSFAEAAGLLLAGTTAAEMLHVVRAAAGETVLVHGASGAVGVSLLQQARRHGIQVVGTASPARHSEVRRFGATPVAHGAGLLDRLGARAPAPGGFAAALDCAGTAESLESSLALVADRDRIVTIADKAGGHAAGVRVIGGDLPASAAFRDAVRADLLALAAAGDLVVPLGQSYPLAEAMRAARVLAAGHPGGKLTLVC